MMASRLRLLYDYLYTTRTTPVGLWDAKCDVVVARTLAPASLEATQQMIFPQGDICNANSSCSFLFCRRVLLGYVEACCDLSTQD